VTHSFFDKIYDIVLKRHYGALASCQS